MERTYYGRHVKGQTLEHRKARTLRGPLVAETANSAAITPPYCDGCTAESQESPRSDEPDWSSSNTGFFQIWELSVRRQRDGVPFRSFRATLNEWIGRRPARSDPMQACLYCRTSTDLSCNSLPVCAECHRRHRQDRFEREIYLNAATAALDLSSERLKGVLTSGTEETVEAARSVFRLATTRFWAARADCWSPRSGDPVDHSDLTGTS